MTKEKKDSESVDWSKINGWEEFNTAVQISQDLLERRTQAEKDFEKILKEILKEFDFPYIYVPQGIVPFSKNEYGYSFPDFVVNDKLIIEIDGKAHEDKLIKKKDKEKNKEWKKQGYIVLRFNNNDIYHNKAYVKKSLVKALFKVENEQEKEDKYFLWMRKTLKKNG